MAPLFESIKQLVELLIVPLHGRQLVCIVNTGEGVDQVGAQIWINIFWHKFPTAGSILGPVSEVTHQPGGGNLKTFVIFLNEDTTVDIRNVDHDS